MVTSANHHLLAISPKLLSHPKSQNKNRKSSFASGIGHQLARGSLPPESKFPTGLTFFWHNLSIFRCRYCEWSRSGGLKKPQPDNRSNAFPFQFSNLEKTFNLSIWSGRQSRAARTRVALGSSTTSTKTASSGTILSAGTRNQSFVR